MHRLAPLRIVFHAEGLPAVLAILRPYRRQQLSESERGRLRAMGAAALGEHRAGANVQSDFTPPESTQSPGDNPEAGAA